MKLILAVAAGLAVASLSLPAMAGHDFYPSDNPHPEWLDIAPLAHGYLTPLEIYTAAVREHAVTTMPDDATAMALVAHLDREAMLVNVFSLGGLLPVIEDQTSPAHDAVHDKLATTQRLMDYMAYAQPGDVQVAQLEQGILDARAAMERPDVSWCISSGLSFSATTMTGINLSMVPGHTPTLMAGLGLLLVPLVGAAAMTESRYRRRKDDSTDALPAYA